VHFGPSEKVVTDGFFLFSSFVLPMFLKIMFLRDIHRIVHHIMSWGVAARRRAVVASSIFEQQLWAAGAEQEEIVSTLSPARPRHTTTSLCSSLEDWERERGWESVSSHPAAKKLKSHQLSYPLTLATLANVLLRKERKKPSIYIVGARAEAMLPSHLWSESLLASPVLKNGFLLSMVGPDTPSRPKEEILVGNSSIHITRTGGLAHDRQPQVHAIENHDLVILFNPGLASAALRAYWLPTLDLLFSHTQNVPVALTAHSRSDVEADVNYMKNIFGNHQLLWLIPPVQRNPFGSKKMSYDPVLGRQVYSNMFLYAVQQGASTAVATAAG
jgi:hypothetical protein